MPSPSLPSATLASQVMRHGLSRSQNPKIRITMVPRQVNLAAVNDGSCLVKLWSNYGQMIAKWWLNDDHCCGCCCCFAVVVTGPTSFLATRDWGVGSRSARLSLVMAIGLVFSLLSPLVAGTVLGCPCAGNKQRRHNWRSKVEILGQFSCQRPD